jgi:murein L,D-transpeptidase YcbB/YkuD
MIETNDRTARRAVRAAALSLALLLPAPAGAQSDARLGDGRPEPAGADADSDAPAAPTAITSPFSRAVRALLETRLAADAGVRRTQDLAILQTLYRTFGFRPLWTREAGAGPRAEAAVAAIADAAAHGLDPDDYGASALAALLGATRPDLRAEFEVRLGLGLMAFAGDLSRGRTVPGEVFAENHLEPAPIARGAVLTDLLMTPGTHIAAALERLAPPLPEYRRLQDALAALRAERGAARGAGLPRAWPRVTSGETLEPGADDPRIAQVRARLLATGDLTRAEDRAVADPAAMTLYDPALEAALRDFQARHGLAVDGLVGPKTLEALNVPIEARIRQVLLNLERLRWMPDDLGSSHILVNLADYAVTGVFEGERLYWSRAVVGDPYNRTPVFSDEMEYLEINPYWNVPRSIATEEILPKVREQGPGYLTDNDYEVLSSWRQDAVVIDPHAVDWSQISAESFGFRFRQKPGPGNALGQVKFMFPNRFDIYLHDTPARRLFERPRRAFSHGCVRLDKPFALAEILLRDDPDWTPERIRRTVAGGQRTIVSLPETVPVHITYLTAWVDDRGTLQFRDDVYGRDEDLAAALLEPRATVD